MDYVEALIAHVASRSCIVAFQVENEPLDKAGEKRQIVGIDFVAEEANLVRKIDTNLRPIIISAWCWSFKHDFDVKDALRYGNILGLDVYSKVRGDDTTGVERAGKLPKHYKELANAKGREAWITELQAESWNPSTFDPDDMKSLLKKVSDVSSSLATHSHIRTFAHSHIRNTNSSTIRRTSPAYFCGDSRSGTMPKSTREMTTCGKR